MFSTLALRIFICYALSRKTRSVEEETRKAELENCSNKQNKAVSNITI